MKNKIHEKYSAFSYKAGSSILHKCPSWLKLLFIPVINIVLLCLPPLFAVFFVFFQFLLACLLHFSIKEQFKDLKPILLYAVILLSFQLILLISNGISTGSFYFSEEFSWKNKKELIFMFTKLISILQSTSLLFRTTTSLELREGISIIESKIRKILHLNKKTLFTDTIFLFLNFIPIVSKIWQESKKAWFARGGKNGIKMYLTLLPVLFSVGIKKAYNQARALEIRN